MDNKKVTMTIKEIKRGEVITWVEAGKITGSQAAKMMGISLRQTRRIIKKYRAGGAASLAHGNRGKPSPNRLDPALTAAIRKLLKEKYADYNTLHLSEVLEERHALSVSVSSLTRIRRKAGYPTPRQKKSRKYYARRERKPLRGQMLQADGSVHDWLEGRGPKLTLIAYIDDATNQVYATFREQEDAAGYLEVLQEICLTEGIPQSMYMDKRLTSRKKASLVTGKEPKSQFERVLDELGIELIPAHSPQAKGRIERLFETLQDRLVKALREASADSLEKAISVLKRFLPKHNQRFMVKAEQQDESAFVPWGEPRNPYSLFAFKYTRTVKNDNTISFDNHPLQLPPGRERCSFAKAKVVLLQHLDGGLTVHYKDIQIARFAHKSGVPLKIGKFTPARDYSHKEIQSGRRKQANPKKLNTRHNYSPGKDHPWKQNYGYHLNGKLICRKDLVESG